MAQEGDHRGRPPSSPSNRRKGGLWGQTAGSVPWRPPRGRHSRQLRLLRLRINVAAADRMPEVRVSSQDGRSSVPALRAPQLSDVSLANGRDGVAILDCATTICRWQRWQGYPHSPANRKGDSIP